MNLTEIIAVNNGFETGVVFRVFDIGLHFPVNDDLIVIDEGGGTVGATPPDDEGLVELGLQGQVLGRRHPVSRVAPRAVRLVLRHVEVGAGRVVTEGRLPGREVLPALLVALVRADKVQVLGDGGAHRVAVTETKEHGLVELN